MAKRRRISIGVGVFILHPVEKKTLYTRRKAGSSWGAGAVALPGGHIEEFEKAYDCAVRECLEETGLVVRPRLIYDYTYVMHAEEWFRQGKHHWTLYMAADVTGGVLANPEPHKHEDWQWGTVDQLKSLCGPDDWIPLPALVANQDRLWEKISA